jgi:RHS repeat-associated protein
MGWAADPARKQDSRYTISFVQMGARVYIPSLGRFLQVDPVDGGTLNGYVYVADPINASDYNGRWGIGNLFSAIVNVVKRVVKAIVTPIAAVVRAAVSYASPPKAAVSSGGRTGGPAATVRNKSIMTNPNTGKNYFDIQSTKPAPGNTYKPGPASGGFNPKSIIPPAGYSINGAISSVVNGCGKTGGAFMLAGMASAPFTEGVSIPASAVLGCGVGTAGNMVQYMIIGDSNWQDSSITGDVRDYLNGVFYK